MPKLRFLLETLDGRELREAALGGFPIGQHGWFSWLRKQAEVARSPLEEHEGRDRAGRGKWHRRGCRHDADPERTPLDAAHRAHIGARQDLHIGDRHGWLVGDQWGTGAGEVSRIARPVNPFIPGIAQ
jgi:hypothetical protein